MAKWLTSLLLIITVAGGALAGFPLHSDEQECSMMGMSCCATALGAQEDGETTPAATTARLCCALNCPQPGSSGSITTLRLSPSVANALHQSALRPPIVLPISLLRFNNTPISPPGAQPAYIRNLTLLI
jgi:hypothetical protein